MKTIIDTTTNKVLFASLEEVTLLENQIAIAALVTDFFVKAHYNFETQKFYEGATQEEIDLFNSQITE
jgi:hypothetical protein